MKDGCQNLTKEQQKDLPKLLKELNIFPMEHLVHGK